MAAYLRPANYGCRLPWDNWTLYSTLFSTKAKTHKHQPEILLIRKYLWIGQESPARIGGNGMREKWEHTSHSSPFRCYTQVYRSVFGAGHLLQDYRIGIGVCVRCAPNKQSLDTKYFTTEVWSIKCMDGRCALHTNTLAHLTHSRAHSAKMKAFLWGRRRVAYVRSETCFQSAISLNLEFNWSVLSVYVFRLDADCRWFKIRFIFYIGYSASGP